MNSKAVYTEPVNRIKQRILFDDNLDNLSTLCPTWEDFVIEVSEWGIYELGGVDFDTLTSNDIERLNQFQKNQGYQSLFLYLTRLVLSVYQRHSRHLCLLFFL